ncbi:hypothetical protein IQ06DRAFT_299112 [Phaeosphaeriaceae sp. SRC1lsM3a]|nr:hypothetical protein IQ06DRAFT_299112 [Stagonospora sp. SRC1lsM3a]
MDPPSDAEAGANAPSPTPPPNSTKETSACIASPEQSHRLDKTEVTIDAGADIESTRPASADDRSGSNLRDIGTTQVPTESTQHAQNISDAQTSPPNISAGEQSKALTTHKNNTSSATKETKPAADIHGITALIPPAIPTQQDVNTPLTLHLAPGFLGSVNINGVIFTQAQADCMARHMAAEHSRILTDIRSKVADQIDAAIFHTQAHFGRAVHQLLCVPVKRQEKIQMFDGTTFDPNPPGLKYPDELAVDLRKAGENVSLKLSSLGELITEAKHPPYHISREMIHKALQPRNLNGSSDFLENLHRLYIEEPSDGLRLTPLPAEELGKDWAVTSKPPTRLASQTGTNATPSSAIKHDPDNERHPPKHRSSVSGGKAQNGSLHPDMKETSKKKKSDTSKAQKWRENPKNCVSVYLEATEEDIARTYQSFWGQQTWESEGYILPAEAVIFSELPEGPEKDQFKNKPAKYCTTNHGSGWLVIVASDVRNCNECQHSTKWMTIAGVYLPPSHRCHILRRNWSINADGDVLNENQKLAASVNNITNLMRRGKQVWQPGQKYTRVDIGTPDHIRVAFRSGKLANMTFANPDRWLKKADGKIKHKIKFDKKSRAWQIGGRNTAQFLECDGDDHKTLANFHAQRMQEVWDCAGFGGDELEKTLVKLLKYLDELEAAGNIPAGSFNQKTDWLTRDDADEFRNRGSLERLIIHLGGQVPKSRKEESSERKAQGLSQKKAQSKKAKDEAVTIKKRQADSEAYAKNAKKIKEEKVEDFEEDDFGFYGFDVGML